MSTITNNPVMLYTEQTPNPESLKFVTNKMIYRGTADFKTMELAEEWSPLATTLFQLPYVKCVYICNNFVTITKEFNYQWSDIMLKLKEQLKGYIEEGDTVIKEGFAEAIEELNAADLAENTNYSEDDVEIINKIKELIDTYVKPAVEMDGGNIQFKSYNQGVVSVLMQGACSGCPSSSVTLQSGIEGMLKRMIPEITQVIAIPG